MKCKNCRHSCANSNNDMYCRHGNIDKEYINDKVSENSLPVWCPLKDNSQKPENMLQTAIMPSTNTMIF